MFFPSWIHFSAWQIILFCWWTYKYCISTYVQYEYLEFHLVKSQTTHEVKFGASLYIKGQFLTCVYWVLETSCLNSQSFQLYSTNGSGRGRREKGEVGKGKGVWGKGVGAEWNDAIYWEHKEHRSRTLYTFSSVNRHYLLAKLKERKYNGRKTKSQISWHCHCSPILI